MAAVAMLLALVCAVAGALRWGAPDSVPLIVAATLLGCVAGLSTCVREHRAGQRSHASVLAGTLAALVSVPVLVARLPAVPALLVVTAVFAGANLTLQRHFERGRVRRR